jgi:tetratricopeptide (TPR) repeat protein
VRLIQYKVAKLILSHQRPDLCPKLRLEFSEWMLRQGLVSPQEMNPALTQWLKELETGGWKAPALYLLGQIQPSNIEKELYFHKMLEIKTLNESLKALACAQIERLSSHPSYLKVENLIAIASQSQSKTREIILSSALDIAIDHHLFQINIEPLLINIEPSSPLSILYQEWRLQQPLSNENHQQAIALLKKGAERADLWGLRACTVYARTLAQSGSFDKGIQTLIKWSSFSSMHEDLQRKALMEIADLYYRQNQMPQARKYISQIMEKWPQFDERPWLQLRQYSEKEYMIGTAESRACLKDIQERYPKHPACLIAASIEAKSIHQINGPSVQSLKAWEDVLTAARAVQKVTGLDADAQETYVQALIEKTRCLEHIGMKKQALTSLKSVTNTASLHELGLSSELEHRLRLEAAIIEFDLGEVQIAQDQLEALWQDLSPSKWQIYAALKLAEIKLWCGNNEDCLKILEKLSCHNENQLQERLILAARANNEMGYIEKRQAYLNELLKRPSQTIWQQEALWYVYLWNNHTQPKIAEKALRALSKTSHPLAIRAKNILSGQTLETPATSIRRTQP